MFYHRGRDVRVLVHGVDFTLSGCDDDFKWVASVFEQKYKTNVRGIMGPDPEDVKAMTILNRIVEWHDGGITLEADPRHADIVVKELGLASAKGADITGGRAEDKDNA